MSAPDKCPFCSAPWISTADGWSTFECRTITHMSQPNSRVVQCRECLQRERDQLASRVKKLEAWIADLDEIGRHSSTSEHREWNGEIGWLLKGQVAYVGEVKP